MFFDIDWPSLITSIQAPFSELQATRCFHIPSDVQRTLRKLHSAFKLLHYFCQLLAHIRTDSVLQAQHPDMLTTVPGAADGSLLRTLCYILTTFAWVYTDHRITSVRGVERFDKYYVAHALRVAGVTKLVNTVAGYAKVVMAGQTNETMEAELQLSCAVLQCSLRCEMEEGRKRRDGVAGRVRKEAWLERFRV